MEKYEAHAIIKYKEDEKEETSNNKIETYNNLLIQIEKLMFQKALIKLYNKGMKFEYTDPEFMIEITNFFLTSTVAFYMKAQTEEECIKGTNEFLDALKRDTIESIKHNYKLIKELKEKIL